MELNNKNYPSRFSQCWRKDKRVFKEGDMNLDYRKNTSFWYLFPFVCFFYIIITSGLFAGQDSTLKANIIGINISPNGWSRYGTYEVVEFECLPIWNDEKPDSECQRAGAPPEWTASGYGKIEGVDQGRRIIWNSGHGAGKGVLKVTYGGITTEVSLNGNLPDKNEFPLDYFSQYVLPQTTKSSQNKFLKKTTQEWEEYYDLKIREAKELSDQLEKYIRDWSDGKAPAKLPDSLLPPSINNEKTKDWILCRPEEVSAEEQWYCRLANEIPKDFSKLFFLGPDNHCTYSKLLFFAPFDSRLVIEGDFPHCRFMDYQILCPFDPRTVTGIIGAPEVPIVDIDIEPDSGNINPFRTGADRNANNRHYHIYFELKRGNAVALNPQAMKAPEYRAPGNTRVGGPFAYPGAVGDGCLLPSVIWLRYYAPDHGTGPFAGVPLPKAYLELQTGEKFWIKCDFGLVARRQNVAIPGYPTPPKDPPSFIGPKVGWLKMFSIALIMAEARGIYYVATKLWGKILQKYIKKHIRNLDKNYLGRGPDMPPPGNYECSATCCNYISYLCRPITLGDDKVIVLTGKLPVTPKTRNSEPVATVGECRYWSIAHYSDGQDGLYKGVLYGCLMDDEIALDAERRYIIVYSRSNQRPRNAVSENGVTWQAWGPKSEQSFTIRWMSIMPEEHLSTYAPHQISWATGSWSQPKYDKNLVGKNEPGVLGPYHPVIHYMTRAEFEALGDSLSPDAVPVWE